MNPNPLSKLHIGSRSNTGNTVSAQPAGQQLSKGFGQNGSISGQGANALNWPVKSNQAMSNKVSSLSSAAKHAPKGESQQIVASRVNVISGIQMIHPQ